MSRSNISVLFVDDEENNLIGYRANFRRDFAVHTAPSAKEALAFLEENNVQVIVSDQRMPTMTGVEFFAIVKDRYPHIIRIILTGYTDVKEMIDAINTGHIFGFMNKPFDPSALRSRIEQGYDLYQLRAEKDALAKRYDQVFNSAGDPILIMDRNGKVYDVNPAAEKLVDHSKADLIQNGCLHMVKDPNELMSLLLEGDDAHQIPKVDISLRTGSGKHIDCLLTLTYFGKGSEDEAQFQAMLMDITDRKEKEERLKRAKRKLEKSVKKRTMELEQAMQDLESFSYTVAHDLRSPVKNIQALSEHLNIDGEVASAREVKALSDMIKKGSTKMLELIDDLLRFAHSNISTSTMEQVDLAALLGELQTDLVPKERIARTVISNDPLPFIFTDGSMVKVVLTNLISNSVKFTRNEPEARIHIGFQHTDGSDILYVKDNGVGFDHSKQTKVFKAFKRMHRNDQFEGTGIGLAIVKRIMDKLGGEVWAESHVGEGTTIYLRFPHQLMDSGAVNENADERRRA